MKFIFHLFMFDYRTDSFRQAYSFAGTSSSTSLDTYVGNGHPPQVYQNFPSRFRQQPVQWHSSNMHGDNSRQYCQPSHLNYNVDESPSFNNSMFSNSLTWGNHGASFLFFYFYQVIIFNSGSLWLSLFHDWIYGASTIVVLSLLLLFRIDNMIAATGLDYWQVRG